MFNLKALSSIKRETVKVHAGSNFISAITEAKQEVQKTFDGTDDNYSNVFMEALNALEEFAKSDEFNADKFELAVDKLAESINLKSNKPEPYFYLAWLFHFANEDELALKYLKVVSVIKSDFKGLNELKDSISSAQLNKSKGQSSEFVNSSKSTIQPTEVTQVTENQGEQKVKLQPLAPRKASSAYGQYGRGF